MKAPSEIIPAVRWMWLLPLLSIIVSCTSFRTVTPSPEVVLPTIRPKDRVQIKLVDGMLIRRIKVVTIDSVSLVGTYSSNLAKGTEIMQISEIRGIQNLKNGPLYMVVVNSFVRITLKSGERIKFKVTGIDKEKIESVGYRSSRIINLYEISKMEVRVADTGESVGMVLLVGVLGFAVLIAALFGANTR